MGIFLPKGLDDGKEPSYEVLQGVEKQRKELVKSGRSLSRLKILTSITGTILPHLLRSRQAWSTFLLYVILRILLGLQIIEIGVDVPQINTSLLTVVGGFMSFFLVFFLSQAYSRFMAQYDISKRMEGRIIHTAYLSKVSLPPEDAWRLLRYINTAHVLGYVGLSETYNEENLFNPLNERFKLLTMSELHRIQEIGVDGGAAPYQEIIGWCIDLLYEIHYRGKPRPYQVTNNNSNSNNNSNKVAMNLEDMFDQEEDDNKPPIRQSPNHKKNNKNQTNKHFKPKQQSQQPQKANTVKAANCVQRLDFHSMQIMMEELLTFRNLMSSLFAFADQTFPYSYIHLTLVICSIYLPLFAYCTATFLPTNGISLFPHLLGALFVIINIVFVIGVREIGRQMIDPYGMDCQDLSVIQYLENGINASRRIICGYRFASPGLLLEDSMENERPERPKPFRHAPFKYALSNASSYLVTNVNHDQHHHHHQHHAKKQQLQETMQQEEDDDEDEEEDNEEEEQDDVVENTVHLNVEDGDEEEEEIETGAEYVDYEGLEMGELYPDAGPNSPASYVSLRPAVSTNNTNSKNSTNKSNIARVRGAKNTQQQQPQQQQPAQHGKIRTTKASTTGPTRKHLL